MKRRILSIFCVLTLCLTMLPVTSLADEPKDNWTNSGNYDISWYSEGTATAYSISDAADLAGLAVLVNGLNGQTATDFSGVTITLTDNIDLSGHYWSPMGTSTSNYFKGTFDGDGHTISNLTINTDANYVGLFGATSGATLKNVTLDEPQVQNSAGGTSYTGALVGFMAGNGTTEYCAVTNGSVSSAGQYVGGLIGYFHSGTVQYCYNLETEVSSSYSTQTYVNGVAGRTGTGNYLRSSFSYVSNQKELKASNNAQYAAYLSDTPTERTYGTSGGQYGFTAGQFQDGTVAYFLRTGFYSGVSYVDWGQTLGTDALPKWKGEAVESLKYGRLGDNGTAEDAYAYFNALTHDTDGTYYIENTSDWIAFVKLVNVDKVYNANAVVREGTVINFSQFGTLTNNSTYSYLVIADYYSNVSYTGTFIGNGCTVKGVSYSGAMEFALFGTIGEDGSVSGITLEMPEITGTTTGAYNIAGIASHNYGTIENCHVKGGTISTVATTAAGIAAESFGTVKNCTNSADITAKYEVAGIVATSNSTNGNTSETDRMVIEGCSNSGTITATYAGSSHAGGIFGGKNQFSSGYPYGIISKCFNTGNILGQSYIGGIVGYSIRTSDASAVNITIENCYNTGAIGDNRTTGVAGGISTGTNSSVTNCFNMGDVTGTNAQPIVANGYNTQAWSDNSYASCDVTGPSANTTLYYGADDNVRPWPTDEQGRYCLGSGKRTDAEMASGEVAYLLQQGQTNGEQVWSQQIGVDKHPVLVINGEPKPVVLITVMLVNENGETSELTKCYTNKESTLSAYPEPDDPGAMYTFYTEAACINKIDTTEKTYDGDTIIYAKVTELIKVTVSGIEVDEKTYDGLSVGYTGSVKATYGDTDVTEQVDFDYSWYSINGSSETLLTSAPADAGSYKLVVSVDSDTYTGQQVVKFKITQKAITAAVTGSVTKEYDGDITVPANHSLNIQFTGVIEADKNDVTADTSKLSYTYQDANIGEGKTITANNVTLSGSRAFNYLLTGTVTGSVGNITAIQIKELTSPTAPVLTEYYSNASEVIAKLPTATTGTTTSGDSVSVTLGWRIKDGTSYNSAPSATNSFTWTATAPENYEFASDVKTSGTITVTNKSADSPTITGTGRTVTYDGNTIDVSTMFSGIPAGSNPTYSIVEGSDTTGEGTLSGTGDLTVTKAGTFQIKVTTEAVGNYAAGEAIATLTVNKGSFTATVTMDSYAQGETPSMPSVSTNPGNGNVTYYYSTTDTTGGGTEWTTDKGKDLDVGTYYMYAVIAATDLYNSCTTSTTSFQVIDAAAGIVPPTAKDLTYTGEPQELIEPGSIEDDTMVYSLSEDGPYSEAIPTGINAGTYYVWYKAEDAAEASGSVSVQIQQAVIVSFDIPEDYYLKALYTKGEDVAALLRNEFDPVTGRTADGTEIKIKINGWKYDTYINTTPSAVNEFGWWINQSNPYMDNYTLADSLLDDQSFASGTIDVHNLPNVTITFDANGGSVQPSSATTVNYKLESLPTPTRSGYVFDGWFTQETDGEEVTTDTVFIADTTIYAHWSYAPTPVSPSYRVTVEDTENGEVTSSHSWAVPGATVTLTVSPGEGYELASLSITKSNGDEVKFTDMGNGKFTFTMPASNVKVTAVFRTAYDACPRDEACPIWPFTDASTTAWYHDGVHYCLENGLMEGVADTLFAPNASLTRAMLVTILWRVEGKPVVNYYMPFTDVDGGAWYAEAVRWAASEGIVNGVTDTSFAPDDPITREQLAAILWRYAKAKGYDVSIGEETNILSYEDFAQISEYAIPAMQWACGAGIINGVTESTLVPQGTATRAQAATMLMRFCENIN